MTIISQINKWFWTCIFYFWSLLVTLGLLVYEMIYIYLHQKYTFGLVVHKTESNQKWPQVKYSGSKPFFDMADNNHVKLLYGKEKGGREEGRMLAETLKVSFFLTYCLYLAEFTFGHFWFCLVLWTARPKAYFWWRDM